MSKKVETETLLNIIIESISDNKGEENVISDLRDIENALCEYFVICTGNNNVQVSSIAAAIERKVKTEAHERPFRVEGIENAQWHMLDYSNILEQDRKST